MIKRTDEEKAMNEVGDNNDGARMREREKERERERERGGRVCKRQIKRENE